MARTRMDAVRLIKAYAAQKRAQHPPIILKDLEEFPKHVWKTMWKYAWPES